MERKSWWRIVLLSLLFCALSVAALAESYSTLRYLDNGSAVLSLQQALNQLGYSTGGADGKYGPATKEAVHRLPPRPTAAAVRRAAQRAACFPGIMSR